MFASFAIEPGSVAVCCLLRGPRRLAHLRKMLLLPITAYCLPLCKLYYVKSRCLSSSGVVIGVCPLPQGVTLRALVVSICGPRVAAADTPSSGLVLLMILCPLCGGAGSYHEVKVFPRSCAGQLPRWSVSRLHTLCK